VGPQFNDLHKFFQEQYEGLDVVVDEIAERATTLGGHAVGALAEFVQLARLKEHPTRYPDAREMLANVLADHEAIIRTLRQDLETAHERYHDMGTHDFLTGLMQRHEKMAWMVRAFLEGKSA
jgi:starvation-inducible DNA-binding protein